MTEENERQELFHTTNLKAATALVTLGFVKRQTSIIIRADGKESMVFWFNPKNSEGLAASKVYHGMTKGGDDLSKSDPENVVNYLRAFAANRDELIGEIRNTTRMVEIRKGDKSALIAENATDEQKKALAKLL
jgi:hypothetical protein